jgi:hypothetical protein
MSGHKELDMTRKALPLFILLIAVIGIATGSANAQTRHKVSFEAAVPFEFVIGNRAFPAGTYVFEMATGSPKTTEQAGVLVVRSHERKLYAAESTDITSDTNTHVNPKVVFVRSGERVYLSRVWRQGSVAGLSVHLSPEASQPEDWQESEVLTLDAAPIAGTI